MEKTKLQLLTDIVAESQEHITPDQLKSILTAVETLKQNSGWGSVTLIFLNCDLDKIEMNITQKLNIKKKE